MTSRVDLSVTIGPWPTDDHAEWSPRDIERYLDAVDGDHAVVRSTVSVLYDPREGNAAVAEIAASHPSILASFVLNPEHWSKGSDGDSLVSDLAAADVRALWLCPARHGWSLTGLEAEGLYERLSACTLPILVELDDTDWPSIDQLSTRLPNVDVVVTGLGYRTIRQAFAAMDAHPRLHVDLSYLACSDGIELFARRYGASRIVMATGAPAKDHIAPWFVLEHSDLSNEERELVAGGNAERILGLSPQERVNERRSEILAPSIDFHAHIGSWPSSWMPSTAHDAVLRSAARVGIVHSVISHLEGIWVDANEGNLRAIEAAQRHPADLSVHLVANPHFPERAQELSLQLGEPVVRGIKVHPDTHLCRIDDARYRWIWELALAARTPVLSHAFGGSPWSDPSLFASVAERYPDLQLVIGHSGANPEGFRATIGVARRYPNIYAEICGSWLTGRWLSTLVDSLGAERVIFGTDSCLIDPRYSRGRVASARLPEAQEHLVLAGNAARLLGLNLNPSHSTTSFTT